MEVVQGKSTDKKIVVAQEIAFAKVLAGNNKALRDRALKKLKKWLTVRGSGKWAFTEEEFIRIWTGLFYCMWMSDKFLVQEELAENISHLIHCFKKKHESAILFINCFHKRLLMEYEGLDQYRIDKFNMLIRRFLRQSFEYCRRTNWDKSVLTQVTNIFSNVVFSNDSALGFVLHFANIYPEELAKVSQGKIECKTVLLLIEPFIKLLAKSQDDRIQKAVFEFFNYLMVQTDVGIEFEEKFKAWRQMGFPGTSINCIKREPVVNRDNSDCSSDESEDEHYKNEIEKPLDPRAGSVHVELPQIPLDINGIINLLKKYEHARITTPKSRRKIRSWIQKFSALRKGKFPAKIKKDPIIDEKIKKSKQTIKNALKLLNYTKEIDSGPIKSKEFVNISKFMERQDKREKKDQFSAEERESQENESDVENENDSNVEDELNGSQLEEEVSGEQKNSKNKNKTKGGKKAGKKNDKKLEEEIRNEKNEKLTVSSPEKEKSKNVACNQEAIELNGSDKERGKLSDSLGESKKGNKKKSKAVETGAKEIVKKTEEPIKITKKRESLNGEIKGREKKSKEIFGRNSAASEETPPPIKKNGIKRKVLNDWQVQELDESSPEYRDIKPQKIIKLEVKLNHQNLEENRENEPEPEMDGKDLGNRGFWESTGEEEKKKPFVPAFWAKDKEKVFKKRKSNDSKIFLNPYAGMANDSSSPGFRRISFALEKNMAQENEEYLEEVKNSPRVPFDGSKKPIQSALKSGLSPSPINPFYRFKKIKF